MRNLLKFVKVFKGDEDVVAWLERAKLIAETSNEELVDVFPMVLDGYAFTIWNNLGKVDKGKLESVEMALVNAFSKNSFEAFTELKSMIWREGGKIEEMAAEMRRLCVKAKLPDQGMLFKCFFMSALPSGVRGQLQTLIDFDEINDDDIVKKAKSLIGEKALTCEVMAVRHKQQTFRERGGVNLGKVDSDQKPQRLYDESLDQAGVNRLKNSLPFQNVRCYSCGQNGHVARYCSKGKRCYRCGKVGHFGFSCTENLNAD